MRAWLVLLGLTTAVGAEPIGASHWQQAGSASPITRVWGAGKELYGVGPTGVHRSTDGGVSWAQLETGAANAVWGNAIDDVWIVRDRTVHHSRDGVSWSRQPLPVPYATRLDGMWGTGNDLYAFGTDRSQRTAVIVHSRDVGQTWKREVVDGEAITGMWGANARDVYAVGSLGVMHGKGDGVWSVVRTPVTGPLAAIWGSPNAIYAVGDAGAIVFFDGKTWSRRTSGVMYALSSIAGAPTGELYAGSSEGAPLRSNDGVTWKPISVLVSKGNVWAGASSVVAAAGDVQVFAQPTGASVLPSQITLAVATAAVQPGLAPPPGPSQWNINPLMSAREAMALRLVLVKETTYTRARDLLSIATVRFGDRFALLPRLEKAGTQASVHVRSITGCGGHTPQLPRNPFGPLIVGEVTCTMTCSRVTVAMRAHVKRHGAFTSVIAGSAAMPISGCNLQQVAVRDGIEAVSESLVKQHIKELEQRLAKLNPTGTKDAWIDEVSDYLLAGGQEPKYRQLLATLLNVPDSWPGLFWNPPPPAPVAPARNICSLTRYVERDAETSARDENFLEAAATLSAIEHCQTGYRARAVELACSAGGLAQAKALVPKLDEKEAKALFPACWK